MPKNIVTIQEYKIDKTSAICHEIWQQNWSIALHNKSHLTIGILILTRLNKLYKDKTE